MKFIRLFIFAVLLLGVLIVAAYFFAPWKSYLETRIIVALNDAGIKNVTFHIEYISPSEIKLTDIKLGQENPLLLKSISLQYSPNEIMAGNLRDVTLSGLHLEAREGDSGWSFTGMDILPKGKDRNSTSQIDLPSILNSMPFSSIKIEDSDLQVNGKSIQGSIPFSLTLSKNLTLLTKPAQITVGGNSIRFGEISLSLAPDGHDNKWNGAWSLSSMRFGDDGSIPEMGGKGSLKVDQSTLKIAGDFSSSDKTYRASIDTLLDISDAAKNRIELVSASLPFKQGRVSTKNVILKLPMTIPLSIQKVSMDDLLQSFTGQKVSATGTISGSIPLIISGDGTYSFGQGSLKSDNAGLITMPGDVIPGDNEQVALVRKILENLHYAVLSAGVKSGKDGKMTVELHLEGNNPDVYNGREVKLNINLTGDVLDIVRQNIILFKNPEKLLEQGYDQ